MRVRLFVLAIFACAFALGADWATWRFDPQRTGWQRDERVLNAQTVRKLALLWKRKLSDHPNGLADPLILGPIITHRGIKELVLTKTSSEIVYAIDADLNTVFWSRDLAGKSRISDSTCSSDLRVTPSMAPSVIRPKTSTAYEDDFSDGNKPLYVLSANGTLHLFRLRTGEDFMPPEKLLPATAKPMSMDVAGNILYIATAAVCGGPAELLWTVDLTRGVEQSGFSVQSQRVADYDRDNVGGEGASISSTRTAFEWQGKEFLVEISAKGKLTTVAAKSQDDDFGIA